MSRLVREVQGQCNFQDERKQDKEWRLGTLTFRDNTGTTMVINAAGKVISGVEGADPQGVRFDTSTRHRARFGREVGPLLTLAMLGVT